MVSVQRGPVDWAPAPLSVLPLVSLVTLCPLTWAATMSQQRVWYFLIRWSQDVNQHSLAGLETGLDERSTLMGLSTQ